MELMLDIFTISPIRHLEMARNLPAIKQDVPRSQIASLVGKRIQVDQAFKDHWAEQFLYWIPSK